MNKRLKLLLVLFLLPFLMGAVQVPEKLTLEVLLSNRNTGLLSGDYNVVVDLIRSAQPNTPQWTQTFTSQTFVEGTAALVLGGTDNPIDPTIFAYNDANFRVTINDDSVLLPLSTVPFSKRSVVSESTAQISDSVLFSVNASGNLGIGTANAIEALSVNGALALGSSTVTTEGVMRWNGDDLQIRKSGEWRSLSFDPDGQEESKWNTTGAGLVQKLSRNVGIGMSAPNDQLAVSGVTNVSDTLLVQGDLDIQNTLSVGSDYSISSTGNIHAREIRLGIDNWVSGDVRAQNNIFGDGSGLTNLGSASFLNNIVSTAKLANNAVETAALALAVITNVKMQDGAITSFNIADATINGSHIDADAITSSKVVTASIGVDRVDEDVSLLDLIADGILTTSKFIDSAVISSKIQLGSVLSYHIADNAVGDSQIADGAITDGKIASFAVQAHHIADGVLETHHFVGVLATENGGLATSNFSANSVPVVGAESWLSNGNGAFWISGTERLGLGTNSPGFGLDIVADSGTEAIVLNQTSVSHVSGFFLQNNLASYAIYNHTDGSLRFSDGLSGTSGVMIGSTGRVKIGSFTADGNEMLVVDGGIQLGDSESDTPENGTIRFDSDDFEGYDGGWSSLQPTGELFLGVSFGESLSVAGGLFAVVGGGESNVITAGSTHAAIGGGLVNEIYSDHGVIVGGRSNTVNDAYSSIGGGQFHSLSGEYSVIGGGGSNGVAADYAVSLAGNDAIVTANYGVVAGEDNGVGGLAASVLGGENNNTQGAYSTIVGGQDITMGAINVKNVKGGQNDFGFLANAILPPGEGYSAIIGGKGHHMQANYSTILGGDSHRVRGVAHMVGGGQRHTVNGAFNMVLSGTGHSVSGLGNMVGGGDSHSLHALYSSVLGGRSHALTGENSSIGGGVSHQLQAQSSVIMGGDTHSLSGERSTVLGGQGVALNAQNSVAGGGADHRLSGEQLTAVGGYAQQLSGTQLAVSGGFGHSLSGKNSAILGGEMNVADGHSVAVGGGERNHTSLQGVVVAGSGNSSGRNAVAGGGQSNLAQGVNAVVAGGADNAALAENSVVMGRGANATHSGSFVFSDGFSASTIRDNEFVIAAHSGLRFLSSNDGYGVSLSQDSGGWSNVSDKHKKTTLRPVYLSAILKQLDRLSVSKWSYKSSGSVTHMGPTSQDFYSVFGLGATETKINSVDADGVILAGIKGVYTEFETLESQLESVSADLKQKKMKLKRLRERMANQEADFLAFKAKVESAEAEATELKKQHIARLRQFDTLLKEAQAMVE